MPPKKQNKNSGVSSKENDQSLMNSENLTTQMNMGPLKPTNENVSQKQNFELNDSKPNKASRNSSNASNGKKSKGKKEAPANQKDQAKPIISEKPTPTPPKDWDDRPQPLEINFTENQELGPNDEKSQVYEEHFPTLGGNDLEVSKPETTFSTEILSPTNVARSQVLKEMTDTSSIMNNEEDKMHQKDFMEESLPPAMSESSTREEKILTEWEKNAPELTPQTAPIQDETPVEEEKIEQYETHFPALGEEQPEVAKPETEFTPELLEPKLIAEEVVEVQPENIIPYLTHDDKKPQDTSESIERTISSEATKISEWERNAPELTQPIIPMDDTPAPEEKVEEYESHFPALGEEPEVAQPETDFTPEILEPKVVAAEAIEVQHENPTPSDYISIDKQADKSTKLDTVANPSRSHVEIQDETGLENPEKETLSTMELQDEPFTVTAGKDKGRESPETFGGQLASEIEQMAQAEEIATQGNEELYEGEEQRMKQDEQLQEDAAMAEQFKPLIEEILKVAEQEERAGPMQESWVVISQTKQAPAFEESDEEREHEGYKPIKQNVADQDELERLLQKPGDVDDQPDVEEKYGEIRVESQKSMKYEEQLEKPKGKAAPADRSKFQSVREKSEGLEPIEEKIVTEDEGNEGLNLQDVLRSKLEKVEEVESRRSLNDLSSDNSKPYEKTSLEHLVEDKTVIKSTEATLSSQRIDLIKEEVKNMMGEPTKNDAIFSEVQKNLDMVKGLEKSRMYGAAINILKKNIEILDTRIVRHDDFNVEEMNRLLVESNTECSYCYSHVSEHKLAIDYARAALNLNPKNIKSIYLLGSNLLKTGDQLGGYNVLKEARRIIVPENEIYHKLIEIELQKCENRAIEVERELEPILKKPGTPSKEKHVRINVPAQEEAREKPANEVLARLGVLTGTAGLSGLVSWIVTKNYLDMPSRKSAAYSIGIGAFVGGLSLFLLTHLGKGTKNSK